MDDNKLAIGIAGDPIMGDTMILYHMTRGGSRRNTTGLKKLVRTVPMPEGDDYSVHEDVMGLHTQILKENDTHISVCMGCHKPKPLNDLGVCKECQYKIDNKEPFKVQKGV